METNETTAMQEPIEKVTIPETKPKNPKRVAWGKKMGNMNKNTKKAKLAKSESGGIESKTMYMPLLIIGVGVAACVLYYSKQETQPEAVPTIPTTTTTSKPKPKMNFTLQ